METIGVLEFYWGYILGLYWGYNEKENGNHRDFRIYIGVYVRVTWGLYWDNGKKMETTILDLYRDIWLHTMTLVYCHNARILVV